MENIGMGMGVDEFGRVFPALIFGAKISGHREDTTIQTPSFYS